MAEICLLNDSFPPLIDGVANTVINYAENIKKSGGDALVVTPNYPGADDSTFDFPVIRYPSVDLRRQLGYTAGNPFLPKTLLALGQRDIKLLHSHCPVASNFLARGLRQELDVPLVMTYHTKFDIDIANAIHGKLMRIGLLRALVESVSAVDELWVVSKGAGENIKSLGYTGDYVVMANGVDMPRRRATNAEIEIATSGYDLPQNIPVFLFVGRLMWYKGLRIIIDALAALKSQNIDFRMVFIGSGSDETDVKEYVSKLQLDGKCFFTGAIHNRDVIAAWYSRADIFLFPSTFDTNGLVVREAAACSLGTVMIGGSCAAEGVTNGVNGLFIEENAASLAVCLATIMNNKSYMKTIGENASRDLYMSWEDAVAKALERYEIVIDNYRSGKRNRCNNVTDEMMQIYADFLEAYEHLDDGIKKIENVIDRYL